MTASIVDVNVTLSKWPTRRLPHDQTPALVELLRSHGMTQAWAGTFDALLHKDLASANARLAEDCEKHGEGLLLPFGSVNPTHADWEEDVRRCSEEHGMRGLRLYPNYHGYALDDPALLRLLQMASERKLIVQVVAAMEDERMMHPLMRVPPVDIAPLPKALAQAPGARIVLLNASRALTREMATQLLDAGEVWFDIATLEGAGGIAKQLAFVPAERLVFGSHAPLFYVDAAVLKLVESNLSEEQRYAICIANAQRVLAVST